jgi:hypothetical protein
VQTRWYGRAVRRTLGTVDLIQFLPEAVMSPTVFPTRTPFRAAVAGAAVAVLLTACGGDDGGTGSGSPGTARAAGDSTADGFCSEAADLDERVDAALSDLDGGDASVVDAFRQIAIELRGISAPAEIRADWTAMAAGLDRMADAFADVDITDLDSLDSLDDAEGDLTEASTRVEDYLDSECGS